MMKQLRGQNIKKRHPELEHNRFKWGKITVGGPRAYLLTLSSREFLIPPALFFSSRRRGTLWPGSKRQCQSAGAPIEPRKSHPDNGLTSFSPLHSYESKFSSREDDKKKGVENTLDVLVSQKCDFRRFVSWPVRHSLCKSVRRHQLGRFTFHRNVGIRWKELIQFNLIALKNISFSGNVFLEAVISRKT